MGLDDADSAWEPMLRMLEDAPVILKELKKTAVVTIGTGKATEKIRFSI